MKLSLISEEISPDEFYDFYILQYAYHENLPNHDEITKHLRYVAHNILIDHLDQIGNIICNRYSPTKNYDRYSSILNKYKLSIDGFKLSGIDQLSIDNKQRYLRELIPAIDREDLGWFTGETWSKLASWYSALSIPKSIDGMIMLIDKIHNTFHHGGLITDYMKEYRWIEQALHIRNSGSPAQLLRHASYNIRQLVGRSIAIGHKTGKITTLDKIYVALNKIQNKNIDVIKNGKITVEGEFIELSFGSDGRRFATFAEIPKKFTDYVKQGEMIITNRGSFATNVYESSDKIMIEFSKNRIVDVLKPIERYINLATDIVNTSVHAASDKELVLEGHGIGQIKPHYRRLSA